MFLQPGERPPGVERMRRRRAEKEKATEEGDLVAPERHQPGCAAEAEREQHGTSVEAFLEGEKRERQKGIAHDHARVLQACGGGAAHHEHHRREKRRGRTEPPAQAKHPGREPAHQEMRIDGRVEGEHRGLGRKISEERECGREDERLRVGDGGVAGEMIRVPQRKITIREGPPEEAEHRVEMVLGVPGHDLAAQGPGERGGEPDRENRCRCEGFCADARGERAWRPFGLGKARGVGHRDGDCRNFSN